MTDALDVVVIGAGPAGVLAALRAAELGARTSLVTREAFGGMAAGGKPPHLPWSTMRRSGPPRSC